MRRILLLEKVVKNVAEHRDGESCIFGTKDFYFRIKDKKTRIIGPYDFYFYYIHRIPDNLDEEFSVIPCVPGTINNNRRVKRIRQLKDKFPFLEAFALNTQNKEGKTIDYKHILSIRKFKGSRPVSELPKSPYEIYHVDAAELEQKTANSEILVDHIAQKIHEIENKYHV